MNRKILDKHFENDKIDAIVSPAPQTRLWYSKVITSDGWIFIEKDEAHLAVDARYIEYAQKNAKNAKVHLLDKDFFKKFANEHKYKTIAVEKDYVTIELLDYIKKIWPGAKIVNINGQKLRMVKSKEEISLLREAGKISLRALEKVKHMIKDGTVERDIDHQLNFELKKAGASKESFDCIVASGPRGAMPHAQASEKKLKNGELVTIDFGVLYKGYMSDVTRTFHVGEVKDPKLLEIEKILREAQKLGIEKVKPGISTGEIDKVCRDYIAEKGYGKYFLHSTGHGLGIDIHELPNVTSIKGFDVKLEPGMVITVEPGIYIEGVGGIRVEDDILVTENGHEVLSKI